MSECLKQLGFEKERIRLLTAQGPANGNSSTQTTQSQLEGLCQLKP